MSIITRREWGAPPSTSTRLDWSQVRGIAVHHDAIRAPRRHDRAANGCYDRIADIRRAHLQHPTERYSDIAYNYWVCPHDVIFEARGLQRRSGANGTRAANDKYLAVCFAGIAPQPKPESLRALRRLVIARRSTATALEPHSAFVSTACPGQPWRAYIQRQEHLKPPEEDPMPLSDQDLAKIRRAIDARVDQAEVRIAAFIQKAAEGSDIQATDRWGDLDKAVERYNSRVILEKLEELAAASGADPATLAGAVADEIATRLKEA